MKALFINGGVLGLGTFEHLIRPLLEANAKWNTRWINLSKGLSITERIVRRASCAHGPGWKNNSDLHRFRAEWFSGWLGHRRARQVMQSGWQPDVLHFHRQATAYGSLPLMQKIPSIVSIDCTQEIHFDSLPRATLELNIRRDGHIFHRAKAIVATSQWAADSIRRLYPECRTPIHVRFNPVDLALFGKGCQKLKHLEADSAGVTFLFMGNDFRRKGGLNLLKAFRQVREHGPHRLVIVSQDPLAQEGRKEAGVVLQPPVQFGSSDWQEIWRCADALVLPTNQEAFGRVLVEAGAAGLPSIATKVQAIPEILGDGKSGLLVDPDQPDQLADAMVRLAEDPDLRLRLGSHARQHVEAHADADVYAKWLSSMMVDLSSRLGNSSS